MVNLISSENQLAQAIVDRIVDQRNVIQNVARGFTATDVKFDVLPAVIVWYDLTTYPNSNSTKGSATITNGVMWTTEMPLIGCVAYGNSQEEVLLTVEELKLIVSGYYPIITNRDVQVPLRPVHYAVPFQIDGAFCVGIFFQLEWQYQSLVS